MATHIHKPQRISTRNHSRPARLPRHDGAEPCRSPGEVAAPSRLETLKTSKSGSFGTAWGCEQLLWPHTRVLQEDLRDSDCLCGFIGTAAFVCRHLRHCERRAGGRISLGNAWNRTESSLARRSRCTREIPVDYF
jgi:hypothetical protein